jgi:hypothetical protein
MRILQKSQSSYVQHFVCGSESRVKLRDETISGCPWRVFSFTRQVLQDADRHIVVQVATSSKAQGVINQLSSVQHVNFVVLVAVQSHNQCVPVGKIVVDAIVSKLLLVEHEPLSSIEVGWSRNHRHWLVVDEEVRDLCVGKVWVRLGGKVQWDVPAAGVIKNRWFVGEVSMLGDVELLGLGELDVDHWITLLKFPASQSFVEIEGRESFLSHDSLEGIDQVLRVDGFVVAVKTSKVSNENVQR